MPDNDGLASVIDKYFSREAAIVLGFAAWAVPSKPICDKPRASILSFLDCAGSPVIADAFEVMFSLVW